MDALPWLVPLLLLTLSVLVLVVLDLAQPDRRDLARPDRRAAFVELPRSSVRVAPPKPRIDPLEELLSQGGPDTCAGCGRARTVLLDFWFDGGPHDYYVTRACVWCDAGATGYVLGVWDDGVWRLRDSPSTSDQWERLLQLVVAEHLAAIATERPTVPLPHADAVATLWSNRSEERGQYTRQMMRVVLVLNPWLDEGSAQRFLRYLGGDDPRAVAPAVVPPMRDLLPVARDALDGLALLRAELAAAPDATEPASRASSDRGAPDCRVVIQTFLCELDGSFVPRHSLRVHGPLQLAKSDGWDPQDWMGLLTEVRQARAELAALA